MVIGDPDGTAYEPFAIVIVVPAVALLIACCNAASEVTVACFLASAGRALTKKTAARLRCRPRTYDGP